MPIDLDFRKIDVAIGEALTNPATLRYDPVRKTSQTSLLGG